MHKRMGNGERGVGVPGRGGLEYLGKVRVRINMHKRMGNGER